LTRASDPAHDRVLADHGAGHQLPGHVAGARRHFSQGGESCFWQRRRSRISTAGGVSSRPQASRSESSTGPRVRTSFAIPMRRAGSGCSSTGMWRAGRTSSPTPTSRRSSKRPGTQVGHRLPSSPASSTDSPDPESDPSEPPRLPRHQLQDVGRPHRTEPRTTGRPAPAGLPPSGPEPLPSLWSRSGLERASAGADHSRGALALPSLVAREGFGAVAPPVVAGAREVAYEGRDRGGSGALVVILVDRR